MIMSPKPLKRSTSIKWPLDKNKNPGQPSFTVTPVGYIRKSGDQAVIEILNEYREALLGLEGFSHIIVFSWFHKTDTPARRRTLRVHPRGDRTNPLTGVFATRSPARPNPIAITTCRVLSIKNNIIQIDKTDSFDGTPVIDIKPVLPAEDHGPEFRFPDWINKR